MGAKSSFAFGSAGLFISRVFFQDTLSAGRQDRLIYLLYQPQSKGPDATSSKGIADEHLTISRARELPRLVSLWLAKSSPLCEYSARSEGTLALDTFMRV